MQSPHIFFPWGRRRCRGRSNLHDREKDAPDRNALRNVLVEGYGWYGGRCGRQSRMSVSKSCSEVCLDSCNIFTNVQEPFPLMSYRIWKKPVLNWFSSLPLRSILEKSPLLGAAGYVDGVGGFIKRVMHSACSQVRSRIRFATSAEFYARTTSLERLSLHLIGLGLHVTGDLRDLTEIFRNMP